MARYQYRCVTHGFIQIPFPIGTAPCAVNCESCQVPAQRVFGSAALTKSDVAEAKALEMHEESRSSPGVVVRAGDSPTAAPRRGADPRHALLPRP